jgi:TPR repeat protein
MAEGHRHGRYGLPQNQQMAVSRRQRVEEIKALEERIGRGGPEALATTGRQLLRSPGATAQAVALLEKAAIQGDAQIQYELGHFYLSGRNGTARDLEKGRQWWDLALAQRHVKTMEMVAPAYQNGQFGYPVDLLKSKALIELLVEAYRDGVYGADRNAQKERYWAGHLKYFDRLFDMAGGRYLPLDDLRRQAAAGDLQAQYQLGRQMLVAGPPGERQKGLQWAYHAG